MNSNFCNLSSWTVGQTGQSEAREWELFRWQMFQKQMDEEFQKALVFTPVIGKSNPLILTSLIPIGEFLVLRMKQIDEILR